jgi:Tfp pilus assembly protein PilV
MSRRREHGFSAIELLVTLFVGVAFIGAGYQIYSVVIQNNGEARYRSKASNIAYDMLRQYSTQATSPCTAVTPTPTPTIPSNSGLSNPTVTVSITCPYGGTSPTSEVSVVLRYGNPQVEVAHAILVTE